MKAVLVELGTEQNKIHYFTANGHLLDATEVKLAARKVREAMTLDFADNFDYCPVYFFSDTVEDAVKNKKFNGILADKNGAIVANPVIGAADSDYIVVYFGYSQDNNSASPDHKSLIVLNDKMQQIYVIFKSDISNSVKEDGPAAKYSYSSDKFDIEYSPHAEKLNDKMEKVIKRMDKYR